MRRWEAVDWARGLAMILMVMDHAREYSSGPGRVADPMDLDAVTPLLFGMRWASHFCAPTFALLMGVSAYWSASRRPAADAARHFWTRGLLLIVLEFTIIDWSWTFYPPWPRKFFQVIAALGVAQLALGSLVRWGARPMLIIGAFLLVSHNLADGIRFDPGSAAHYIWSFLHQKNVLPLSGGFEVRTTYPVLPVIGLALCGFGLSRWLFPVDLAVARRRSFGLGAVLTFSFLVLRAGIGYGDPNPFVPGPTAVATLFALLNVTKYPLSLQFVLMTIGPLLLLLSWRMRGPSPALGRASASVSLIGRVLLFFYVLHLYALHALALLAAAALGAREFPFATRFGGIPADFGFPLAWIPGIALGLTILLWPVCRWYDQLRSSRRFPVLAYL